MVRIGHLNAVAVNLLTLRERGVSPRLSLEIADVLSAINAQQEKTQGVVAEIDERFEVERDEEGTLISVSDEEAYTAEMEELLNTEVELPNIQRETFLSQPEHVIVKGPEADVINQLLPR